MKKQTLADLVMDFFEPGKEVSVDDILEYVEKKRPGTVYQSVLGTLSRAVSSGELKKPSRGTYILVDPSAPVVTEQEEVEVNVFDVLKEDAEEEEEEVQISEPVLSGEIHPILKRPLTDSEKMIMDINSKIVAGIDLEDSYKILAQQMKDGAIITAMFIGDPGNGKTTVARAIADHLKVPVYSQNFGINSEELDIIGGFVPDEEKGGFKWVDGQFTHAFRNGGVYIAEEPNYSKPGVLGVKNNALDGVGQIVLRNGEVVQRHPAFRYIACMNVGLAGTQRMNLAFINRMKKVIKFDPMSRDKQVQVIMKESGYTNRAVVKRMVEVANQIQAKIKKEAIDNATISIRNLIAWATDVRYTKNIIESAKPTVIWAVCMEEDEVHEEILNDIIIPRFGDIEA